MTQQPFTKIEATKTRYEVVVRARTGTGGCHRCGGHLHRGEETFTCPVCQRICCDICSEEQKAAHFGNLWICTDCDMLPVAEQLRIAAFSAELNK